MKVRFSLTAVRRVIKKRGWGFFVRRFGYHVRFCSGWLRRNENGFTETIIRRRRLGRNRSKKREVNRGRNDHNHKTIYQGRNDLGVHWQMMFREQTKPTNSIQYPKHFFPWDIRTIHDLAANVFLEVFRRPK